MKQEKTLNLVSCDNCKFWDDLKRLHSLCKFCNNSQKVKDPKEFICNSCGGSTRHLDFEPQYPRGVENIKAYGGYESYHLFDDTYYDFSLCELCLRNLFNQFKVPPNVYNLTNGESITYEDDRAQYEYRVWKDTGGHHQAYMDGKCNVVKNCANLAIYTVLYAKDFTEDCVCEEHSHKYDGYKWNKLVKFISHSLRPFI